MRVVIAGAGLVGRRLIATLAANRHDVIAIDLNRDTCEMVSVQLGAVAIHGNATDIATLEQAEIGSADVAVALMRQSADNLAFSLLARSAGASRVLARMRNPKYRHAYEQAGVTEIIDVASLYLDELLLEIERPTLRRIATFGRGQGVVVEVRVPEGAGVVGKTIDEVYAGRRHRHSFIVAAIIKAESQILLIPSGIERVRAGDRLLLSATLAEIEEAVDYLGAKRGVLAFLTRLRAPTAPSVPDEVAQIEMDAVLEDAEETPPEQEGAES